MKRMWKDGALTPNLLWLALCCVLCGEGTESVIYLFSSHTFPQMLLEFEPATFWSQAFVFLTSGLPPHLILDQPLDSALMIQIVVNSC